MKIETLKNIYSLNEGSKILRLMQRELDNLQLDLAFEDNMRLTALGNKYGVTVSKNAHVLFEVDLTKDRKHKQHDATSKAAVNKKFSPYSGTMEIVLESFHKANYLITADCISAENPKLMRKNLKFIFDNPDDLITLIILAGATSSVSVNVIREKDPSVEIYKILGITSIPNDLFDDSVCSRCPVQKRSNNDDDN
jgi:hypothetical protein